MNGSIQYKLSVINLITVVVFCLIIVFLSVQLKMTTKSIIDSHTSEQDTLVHVQSFSKVVEEMNGILNLITLNAAAGEGMDSALAKSALEQWRDLSQSNQIVNLDHIPKDILEVYEQFQSQSATIIDLLREGLALEAAELQLDVIPRTYSNLTEKVTALLSSTMERLRRENAGRTDSVNRLITATSTVSPLLGILLIAIALFLNRKFVMQPIQVANRSLRQVSDNINSLTQDLQYNADDLTVKSTEQAQSIEETSAALHEIHGIIDQNLANSQKSFGLSQEVSDISKETNEQVSRLQSSMDDILESNKSIREIKEILNFIAEQTEFMNDIVFQTKLLSFNASIEAARAGRYGKGFSVVAREVANLAEMTGKASQKISDVLATSISRAQTIVDNNNARVQTSNQYLGATVEGMDQVLDKTDVVSGNSKRVLDGSREQTESMQSVTDAMGTIEKVTQRGRRDKPIEFGHKIVISQSREKFITGYQVLEERVDDRSLLELVIEQHVMQYGKVPNGLTADKGFCPDNETYSGLEERIEFLEIPRRSRDYSDILLRSAQHFRAGIEGSISCLKRAFRLSRCFFKGFKNFSSAIGSAIFCHNLTVLARQTE